MEPDLAIYYGFKRIVPGYTSQSSFRKGEGLFEAGHVLKVAEFRVGNRSIITSQVVRQTSVNLTPYDVRIELNSNREAVIRHCSCAAGEGSICKHISATIVHINSHTGASKTDQPQLWGKPSSLQSLREKYSHAKAVQDLYPLPKKMKMSLEVLKPANITSADLGLRGIPCALSHMLVAEEKSVGEQIVQSIVTDLAMNVVTLSVQNRSREVLWQVVDFNFTSTNHGKSFYDAELVDSDVHLQYFEHKIKISPVDVVNIAVETIDQSENSKWFHSRTCRISASSKAHRIKIRKKDQDLLADHFITPNPFKGNQATRYGNQMEKTALQDYETTFAAAGTRVIECGVIIRERQPWLCASPDGIIVEDGIAKKVLEIKCPFKCKKSPVINEDGTSNVPYLIYQGEEITLKETHMYYTQVQMQMYVVGLNECHFFVWSPLQMVLVNVRRNDKFLEKVVLKLEDFYFKHYLPKLINNNN